MMSCLIFTFHYIFFVMLLGTNESQLKRPNRWYVQHMIMPTLCEHTFHENIEVSIKNISPKSQIWDPLLPVSEDLSEFPSMPSLIRRPIFPRNHSGLKTQVVSQQQQIIIYTLRGKIFTNTYAYILLTKWRKGRTERFKSQLRN